MSKLDLTILVTAIISSVWKRGVKSVDALAFAFGFMICSSAYADCLDEQRELHRLESATRSYLQSHAGSDNPFESLNNPCRLYGPVIRLKTTTAAFIRHCYAELGMTPLQGEEAAHKQDMGAQTLRNGCR